MAIQYIGNTISGLSGDTKPTLTVNEKGVLFVETDTGKVYEFQGDNTTDWVEIILSDASTSAKGIASFSSDNFAASSGVITIKDAGVLLGTETTGNYVATLTGTANEVEVSASTGAVTVGIPTNPTLTGNTIITGNLTVNGDTITMGDATAVNATQITVDDPIISLANNNAANAVDIGFYGKYVSDGTKYAGLVRDATDNSWYLFNTSGSNDEPGVTTNDILNISGIALADLRVNNLYGTIQTAAQTNITSLGDLNASLNVRKAGTAYIKAESTDGVANVYADSYASPWGGFVLQENSVSRYYILYSTNSNYFSIRTFNNGSAEADIIRIADGTDDVYFLGGIGVGVAAPTSGIAVDGDLAFTGPQQITTSSGDLTLNPYEQTIITLTDDTYGSLYISNSAVFYYQIDTRNNVGDVIVHNFDTEDFTIASASNARFGMASFRSAVVNYTGTTNVTDQLRIVDIGATTLNSIGDTSTITINEAASFVVTPPTEGSYVDLTASKAIHIRNAQGSPGTLYGIYMDSLTAGGTDIGISMQNDLDLRSAGTILNVGVDFNEWTSTALRMTGSFDITDGSNNLFKITTAASGTTTFLANRGGGGGHGSYIFNTRPGANPTLTRMVIDSAGNIGINVTDPEAKLHLKVSDYGVAVNENGDELLIESSGNAGISIAAPIGSIYFGDNTSGGNNQGVISYRHAGGTVDDELSIATLGADSLRLSGGATPTMAFQGTTIISTTGGPLTLDPTTSLNLVVTANLNGAMTINDGTTNLYYLDSRNTTPALITHYWKSPNVTLANAANATHQAFEVGTYSVTLAGQTTVSSSQRTVNIEATQLRATGGNVTVAEAVTLRIAGAPYGGTSAPNVVTISNPYALKIDSGNMYVAGRILFTSGDPTNPGIAFNNEQGTGIYRSGGSQLAISLNTSTIAQFTTSFLDLRTNLKLNGGSSSTILTDGAYFRYHSATGLIALDSQGSVRVNIDTNNNNANDSTFSVGSNGSTSDLFTVQENGHIFLQPTGNVGIGTTDMLVYTNEAGNSKLVVIGSDSGTNITGNVNASITIANTNDTTNNTAALHFGWQDTDGTPTYAGASIVTQFTAAKVAGNYPESDLHFLTSNANNSNPTTKMTILNDGKVGIGTTAPTEMLQVAASASSSSRIRVSTFSDTDTHQSNIQFQKSHSDTLGTLVATVDDEALGYISWNSASNASPPGEAQSANIAVYQDAGPSGRPASRMQFGTSDGTNIGPKVTILSNGNVGIGTVDPTDRLHVAGNLEINSRSTATGNTDIDKIIFRKQHATLGAGYYYTMGEIRSITTGGYSGGLDFYAGKHTGGGSYASTHIMRVGNPDSRIDKQMVLIGDKENVNMSAGLTINQGGFADQILALKSTDVAHGYTDLVETDTFAEFKKISDAYGGLNLTTYIKDGSNTAILIRGLCQNTDTTDTVNSRAVVELMAYNSGTTEGTFSAMNSNENAIMFRTGDSARLIIKGNGDLHGADTAIASLDSYEDAHLVRALDYKREDEGAAGLIRSKWDDFVKYNRQDLIEAGLFNECPEGEEALLNLSQLWRLHNGAIWQGYSRQMEMQERIDELESKLLVFTELEKRLLALEGGK